MTLLSILHSRTGTSHELEGAAAGSATATGALSVLARLAGASAGGSGAAGNLTATIALAGTSAGGSTATGTLSTPSGAFYARVTTGRRPDTTTSARRRSSP